MFLHFGLEFKQFNYGRISEWLIYTQLSRYCLVFVADNKGMLPSDSYGSPVKTPYEVFVPRFEWYSVVPIKTLPLT